MTKIILTNTGHKLRPGFSPLVEHRHFGAISLMVPVDFDEFSAKYTKQGYIKKP